MYIIASCDQVEGGCWWWSTVVWLLFIQWAQASEISNLFKSHIAKVHPDMA